jgi:hypothetical protein
MGDHWSIRPFSSAFHEWELVAKGCHPALAEISRERVKRGVDHAGAGAMSEHEGGASITRPKPQSRDRLRLVDVDFQWFSGRQSHLRT